MAIEQKKRVKAELLDQVRENRGDDSPDDQIIAMVSDMEAEYGFNDWKQCISDELAALWEDLSVESKIVAYLVAQPVASQHDFRFD